MFRVLVCCCLTALAFATNCTYDKISKVKEGEIEEASGLCESRTNPGILYTHNDAGGPNQIYAFHVFSGKDLAHFKIRGAENNDWEDIACQNGYIYIGDIGDKGARTIYRIKEPASGMIRTQTLEVDGKVSFTWNEKESETLMVDLQGNIYFAAKVRYSKADVYMIPGTTPMDGRTVVPQKIATLKGMSDENEATSVESGEEEEEKSHSEEYSDESSETSSESENTDEEGEADRKKGPTGGDMSADNKLIIMKSDTKVYLWRRGDGETVSQALSHSPQVLNYKFQKQDEGICFDLHHTGYYTLPEGDDPKLYFHTCAWN